jgi:hypothetical protein
MKLRVFIIGLILILTSIFNIGSKILIDPLEEDTEGNNSEIAHQNPYSDYWILDCIGEECKLPTGGGNETGS